MSLITLNPPSQLTFQRPLTQLIKRTIQLTSTSSLPVRWKVKTTAPKQYSVRPNGGTIEPGQTVEVQVLLQPMKEDPPVGTKCRDKFLVQSVIITPEREASALTDLWAVVELENKTLAKDSELAIHEQKIRCTYLPAVSELITNDQQYVSSPIDNGPDDSMSSVLLHPATSTIQPSVLAVGGTNSILPTSLLSNSNNKKNEITSFATKDMITPSSVVPTLSPPSSSTTTTSTPTELGSIVTKTTEESTQLAKLQNQLATAQSEINRLETALKVAEESGLRQRKVVNEGGGGGEQKVAVAQVVNEGVPLQVVVGIAAGVFVFTWLFF